MPKPITLSAGYSDGVTVIPNTFFDEYLPRANGEFLKIYLYLLRWLSHPDHALSLSGIADIFFMTENDDPCTEILGSRRAAPTDL